VWCATSCATAPCSQTVHGGSWRGVGGVGGQGVGVSGAVLVEAAAEGVGPGLRRRGPGAGGARPVGAAVAARGGRGGAAARSGRGVSVDELHRLPTVRKSDLWDHYPDGLRLAPPEDIVCVHGSSGTGGRPTLIPYTAGDVDIWATVMARALGGAGAT